MESAEQVTQKPRKSKAAVAAFILGIVSIFLFPLTYLATIIFSIIAFVKIKRSNGQLAGRGFAAAGVLLPLLFPIVLLVIWCTDAPPPEKDYTMADLASVPEEYHGSYDLLMSLSEPVEPASNEDMQEALELIFALYELKEGQKTIGELPDKLKAYFEEQGIDDFQALSEEEQKRHLENCIKGPEEEKEPVESKIGLTDVEIKQVADFVERFGERYIETLDYDFSTFRQEFPEAEQIRNLWGKAQKSRGVFEQLWQYPQIADLTEPRYSSDVNYLISIKRLCRLYQAYIYLCISEGRYELALNEIKKWHVFNQKFFVTARPMVTRLSLLGVQDVIFDTVNYLVNSPAIENSLIERTKLFYVPLDSKVLNFKKSVLFDYLTAKNELDNLIQSSTKNRAGIFKRNSTVRCLLRCCYLSEYQNVWPAFGRSFLPDIKTQIDDGSFYNECDKLYKVYNPGGYLYIGMVVPAYGPCFYRAKRVEIEDDLLQWVLARRMGEEGSLKARAYGEAYTVDVEKGVVFSVGPDGVAYTEDDIKLRIDPAVLGLE